MLDLDQQILAWRNDLLAARMPADVVDELESHLRDDITRRVKSGIGETEAFKNSVRQLGGPADLRTEFQKYGSLSRLIARTKNTLQSFAGIPNHYAFMNDTSLKLDSPWATYLRSALFLLPALVLWFMAAVYITPKFTELWQKADTHNASGLANLMRFDLGVMSLLKDNVVWLIVFSFLALGLLEWRSGRWPRYRRAVFGAGVFIVNFVVLFSFAILFLAATFAAAQLATHPGK